MKKAFSIAALAGIIALAGLATATSAKGMPPSPLPPKPGAMGCLIDNETSDFRLSFDSATGKATLEGTLTLPTPGYSYSLHQNIHIVDDPVYHDMTLTITPPPPDTMVPQVLVFEPVREAFTVAGQKPYVKVIIDRPHGQPAQEMICPVPGRAMGFD